MQGKEGREEERKEGRGRNADEFKLKIRTEENEWRKWRGLQRKVDRCSCGVQGRETERRKERKGKEEM